MLLIEDHEPGVIVRSVMDPLPVLLGYDLRNPVGAVTSITLDRAGVSCRIVVYPTLTTELAEAYHYLSVGLQVHLTGPSELVSVTLTPNASDERRRWEWV